MSNIKPGRKSGETNEFRHKQLITRTDLVKNVLTNSMMTIDQVKDRVIVKYGKRYSRLQIYTSLRFLVDNKRIKTEKIRIGSVVRSYYSLK